LPRKSDKHLPEYLLWRETSDGVRAYKMFARMSAAKLAEGRESYSASVLCGAITFESDISINNNFVSHLARELMENDKRFKEFFKVRGTSWGPLFEAVRA